MDSTPIVNISKSNFEEVKDLKFFKSPYSNNELNYMKPEIAAFEINTFAPKKNKINMEPEEVQHTLVNCSLKLLNDTFITYDDYCNNDDQLLTAILEHWESQQKEVDDIIVLD